ncbi:molybdopterin molybdotransferase MoeA [Cupriavidus pauculus]|uniref:Molybdopterin molybdenumtransferase n=2 Tax=Cupriavidus pauculus TaxID=82633 RepID=A0A5P2H3T1_9BURK|nr:molybdopterin molybdotransferase MoeA [Cupriavidus pauculus]
MTQASPRPPMLTLVQALDALMAGARQIADTETIDTLTANGRVLAAPVTSALRVPPADNTAMDGYAVRAADVTAAGVRLPVSQRIPAGHVGTELAPGTAARIFTGGLIPPGADAVIMQEQCEADGDGVVIRHVPRAGEWVRRAGEDIEAGSVILPAGTRLTPQAVGLAASVGQATLDVTRRVRVAVFFTGDELAMPGEPLKPGAIYNSNRYTLRGLLENLGCEVTDFGIVPDTLAATRDTLRRAADGHDVIITSGGVSVGDEDHVRPAVQAEGRLDLWQIAIKPGKPLAFGAVGETFFLGLPGNPVSSFVTFLLFVRPFLLRMQGVQDVAMRRLPLRADFDLPKGDRRNEFLRARLNAEGGLELFPNQSSGVLTSTVWGEGLIDNPPDHPIRRGDVVPFIPFQGLLD